MTFKGRRLILFINNINIHTKGFINPISNIKKQTHSIYTELNNSNNINRSIIITIIIIKNRENKACLLIILDNTNFHMFYVQNPLS